MPSRRTLRLTRILSVVSATCLLLACGADPAATTVSVDTESTSGSDPAPASSDRPSTSANAGDSTATAVSQETLAEVEDVQVAGAGAPGVDIVLGEWALVPSAHEAPPGTIAFRFHNRGTVPHALRIRTSGSGKNRLEWRAEAVSPGEISLLIADLAPGTYEIDCPVEDGHGEHDALGMEMAFTVREGVVALAPLPSSPEAPPAGATEPRNAVTIAEFTFAPVELDVRIGATVSWSNNDPTPHTVTSDAFDIGIIEPGASGNVTFNAAGTFDYFCVIHPTMRGRVVVDP